MMYEDEYEGPLRVTVKRDKLLEAAANWINALHEVDKWRTTRYEFHNEPAMDSGGVAKEWYRLVCDSIFKPQYGLFVRTKSEDVSYDFNPQSGLYQPERHLYYFRFAGRILAKAILEGCFVESHLSKVIYKHLVKEPLTFQDIAHVDPVLYSSLQYTVEEASAEELEALDLRFVTTVDEMGVPLEVELKKGGQEIVVTKENLPEYVTLLTKYYLHDRYRIQVDVFLKGFHEIIPPSLLVVLNHEELEKVMCGETTIDVDDWKEHVTYRGVYKKRGVNHESIQWFWNVVANKLTEEEKQKLLQFITGSSRVPVGGFRNFQEGNSLLISIESISQTQSVYPRAHTCFNRLELPIYQSEDELELRLRDSLEYTNGFNLE